MIGLSANRLSASRLAGLREARQFRNGQWLEGEGKSLLTPYSVEASFALKAAFPAQWAIIRDYGWEHPALVPFINEDPMLVMSLIEGLGVRGINSNDSGAYAKIPFHAGVVVNNSKAVIKSKITLKKNGQLYSTDCSYGNNLRAAFGIAIMSNALKCNIVGGQAMATLPATIGTTVKIVDAWTYIDVDGVRTNKTGHLDWNDQYIWVFYGNNPSYVSNLCGGDMCEIGLEYDGSDIVRLVPFKKSNNTICFIDVLAIEAGSGQVYYENAASSGSFTISESPS